MSYTVQIERIFFDKNEKEGTDGGVLYVILSECEQCKTDPKHHSCTGHPGMTHHYEMQRFRLGASGHRLNATPGEIADDRAHVWGWDGNREAPTLRPSFLGMENDKKGRRIRPYRMHSYLTSGRLEILADSTVVLHPNPVPCDCDE